MATDRARHAREACPDFNRKKEGVFTQGDLTRMNLNRFWILNRELQRKHRLNELDQFAYRGKFA